MQKEKIDRINELARKAKTTGLTEEETAERAELRKEYLAAVRLSLQTQLEQDRKSTRLNSSHAR